ncbi:MAG: hypothetical protein HY908_13280 [Myxococcales bacterium]|nr:hypothetical protein [Myxococcales bacterium]
MAPDPGAPPGYQGEPARPAPPAWARASDAGAAASGARADAPEPVAPAPRDIVHLVQPELGLRLLAISHDGFEPYGTRDVNALASLALGVMFYPLRVGAFALGVGPEYDVGRRAGTVRGDKAVLVVHRLGVPIVADVALIRHVHLFSRIAPAASYLHGAITDTAIDRSLVANGWTWGFDVSGGVTALLGAVGAPDAPDVAFWASLEGGYAFAGEVALSYQPASDDDDPRSFGAVALPPVAPAGALSRIGVGVSF